MANKKQRKRRQKTARLHQRKRSNTPWSKIGETFSRSLSLRAETFDEEARTVGLSFSSETAVRDFFEPVVLLHEPDAADFSRLETTGAALFNHDPDRIVGPIDSVRLDEEGRVGRATIRFDETPDGDLALKRVRSGSLRGVSVGFVISEAQTVGEDERWKSPEGREFEGPLVVAKRWQPLELSLTPIPADGAVGVGRNQQSKEATMPPLSPALRAALVARGLDPNATNDEAWEFLNNHPDMLGTRAEDDAPPPPPPAEEEEEEEEGDADESRSDSNDPAADERARIVEITRIGRQVNAPADQIDKWISGGVTVDNVRARALERYVSQNEPVGRGPSVDVGPSGVEKFERYASAGLCNRFGLESGSDAPKDAPDGMTLHGIVRELCRMNGERNATTAMMPHLLQTRGFAVSTGSLTNVLENVLTKILGKGYSEVQSTFDIVGEQISLPDFKAASLSRISEMASFEEVPENFHVRDGAVSDTKESIQLATYARKLSVTRQAIINDDLGAITQLARGFAQAARRTKNSTFWSHVISGTNEHGPTMTEGSQQLFSASHASGSNLTDTGTAISATSIGVGRAAMMVQKGLGAEATVGVMPSYLVVPVSKFTLAEQTLSDILVPNSAANVATTSMKSLQILPEPQIDGSSSSTLAWFLFADPNLLGSVAYANLDGQNGPPAIVRTESSDVLGTTWVAYYDFAVKAKDHRGAYRNDGA